MKYLSVCSGIEAATVAWHSLGWEPVAFSEVDAFPSAVLKHHYPYVPNWGDMTTFKDWPDATFDLLVGGTPCQSFSVAGLRKGLDDPRGNLLLVYLALARRYRPRWLVWENVPGVLSSDDGRAFGSLLGGLAELGYGFAYRVLDAQHFGLAQRRARVFVVGCLGDWRRAAAVLFERESLSGHPAPRREAGQVAPTVPARRTGGGGLGTDFDLDGRLIPQVANPLTARMHKGVNTTCDEGQTMIAHSLRADGFDASEDGTGRGTPLVPVTGFSETGQGWWTEGLAGLRANPGGMPENIALAHAFDARQSDVIQYGDQAGPLDTDGHSIAVVAFHANMGGNDGGVHSDGTTPTLTTERKPAIAQHMAVRRLTPKECCRLQGSLMTTSTSSIAVNLPQTATNTRRSGTRWPSR